MTLRERHKAILDLLRAAGSVDVGTLSLRLGVSAVTIRKDLDLLEEKHLLYRTHGGAIPADPYIATRKVSEKEKLRPEAKRRIGMAAVELLSPQDALVIASGTTVQAFARCIPNMKMTVITSAMNVAMELLDKPDIEIIQLGGVIRHSSASVVSEYAVRMLDNFACSKLFLGVDGIDPEYGLSTTHLQEACLNRAMIASATKTVVLADSLKFGRRGFSRICGLGDIDHVITDSGTPPKMLEAMREQESRSRLFRPMKRSEAALRATRSNRSTPDRECSDFCHPGSGGPLGFRLVGQVLRNDCIVPVSPAACGRVKSLYFIGCFLRQPIFLG